MDTTYGSDLDCCTDCGRLLNDLEGWRCGPCAAKHLNALEAQAMTWYDPSDAELERRDAMIERGWRELGAILFGVVVLLIAGTMMWGQNAHAQTPSDKIYAPYEVNERIYEWPYIGTPAYSASCSIVEFYEDGWARAFCTEDGALYTYDPDGQPVPGVAANPVRDAGWYPVTNTR